MLINDTFRFAFVHIPKCAGTMVRNALAPYDQHAERFYEKALSIHPVLGLLDHHHIPLAVLCEHFPEDFARLTAYRSFALIRDPYARFPSSLHERFVQRDRIPLSERGLDEIALEIDAVMADLSRHRAGTPITDPALIHFARQRDYIFLNDVKIVDAPRTIAEANALLADISGIVGQPIRPTGFKNRRLRYSSPTIERLQRAITDPIEKVVPRRIWKPVYKPIKEAFLTAGLIQRERNPLTSLPNAAEIDAFISEFYSNDIALFNELEGTHGARSRKGTFA